MNNNTFTKNLKSITKYNYRYNKSKSYILDVNTPTRMIISTNQSSLKLANALSVRDKRL